MYAITVNEETALQLQKVATEQGDSIETLVETLLQKFLRETARRKMQREADAFAKLHATLLTQYPGNYVAIFQGKLVDHDPEQLTLYQRIEQAYPHDVVLIRQVLPEVEETLTFRSPQFEYEH